MTDFLKQEILTRVWNHFVVNQEPKSQDDEGQCRYHGDGTTRCAIGLLLEDQEYSSDLEGYNLDALVNSGRMPSSFCARMDMEVNRGFLQAIQNAHDESNSDRGTFAEGVEKRLRQLAERYELEVPKDERMSY